MATTLLVQICQNDQVQFGFLQNTYLGLSQAIASVISTYAFWQFQKWRKVTTKKMVSIRHISEWLAEIRMLVCNYKCRDDTDYAVGYDRDLDPEVWVRCLCLLCPMARVLIVT